jgi:hypothetical protein
MTTLSYHSGRRRPKAERSRATWCSIALAEYVVACLAGVFTLDDALMLVATRGRLVQEMPQACMLAVLPQ